MKFVSRQPNHEMTCYFNTGILKILTTDENTITLNNMFRLNKKKNHISGQRSCGPYTWPQYFVINKGVSSHDLLIHFYQS